MTVQASPPVAHELRLDLGNRLRILRLRAGLTGKALADALGCHPSKISRIEHGVATPSVADVRAWCVHCQAEGESPDLEAQVLSVESAYAAWRSEQRAGFLQLQHKVDAVYAESTRFRIYASSVLPGLLQTEEYTTAILTRLRDRRGSPDDVAEAAAARYAQRQVLGQSKVFAFILEESVLRSRIASRDAMRAQLEQLVEDSHRPQVSVGVIPLDVQRTAWPVESHFIYDDRVVRVQLVGGRLSVTTPGDISEYVSAFEELSSLAVVGDEARELVRRSMP